MTHWILVTFVGLTLGAALYLLVRLRMYLAPQMLVLHGPWARRIVWIITILLMITLANGMLIWIRSYLLNTAHITETLTYEIWFGVTALFLGVFLVANHVRRRGRSSRE